MEASLSCGAVRATTSFRAALGCVAAALAALVPASAWAQESPSATAALAPEAPFRSHRVLHVGVTTSAILRADSVCPSDQTLCPLGGGGGIVVAVGRRVSAHREWNLGYELSVRNARNFFNSATLQELRFEHRWMFASPRTNLEGFAGLGGGLVAYGERFGVTTLGPSVGISAGASYGLSAFVSLGVMMRVEALRFLVPFDTGDGVRRSDGGIATVLLDFAVVATFRGP